MAQEDPRIDLTCTTPTGVAVATIGLLGGGIRRLSNGLRDVIPQDTTNARASWSSGATLAPWPNRLQDGRWIHNGATFTADVNEPARGNALHGLVFNRVFTVLKQSADSVTLGCDLGADASYPFAVHVEVEYTLAADGLTVTMRARNASGERVPFGFGVHPYFPWDEGCTVRIDADAMCENDDRLLPTGTLLSPRVIGVIAHGDTPIASISPDDCFTALTRDADGLAHTVITHPDGAVTDVWQDAAMRYVQVFSTREPLWESTTSHAIAIEPQTCPANAFNTGTDLDWLEDGAELVARWGVRWPTRAR